jgi:hypothetical protein
MQTNLSLAESHVLTAHDSPSTESALLKAAFFLNFSACILDEKSKRQFDF